MPADEAGLLALNNAHAVETSWLDAAGLRAMVATAFMASVVGASVIGASVVGASVVGAADAMLIAFDQDARHDGANLRWFRSRLARFVYVEGIITAPAARGRGCARLLYRELFERARAAGHGCVVCEVNCEPPNPGSDRLHAALGFREVGRAVLAAQGKRVRYLRHNLVA